MAVDLAQRRDPRTEDRPYTTRPARPVLQIGVRIAIWAAIAMGALGGLVGLLRPAGDRSAAPVASEPADDAGAVPAPVAGVAEQAIEAWMVGDEDDLARLFVDPPVALTTPEGFELVGMRTVAGEHLSDGYWAVTVLVDLLDAAPETTAEDGAGLPLEAGEGDVGADEAAGPEPVPTSWYVEVGVVGDVTQGLGALTTPSVLPGPQGPGRGWSRSGPDPEPPDADDPVARTVQGFLNALLVGDGDPGPYLAPGAVVTVVDPPPFASVELTGIAVEQIEDGRSRAWVQVDAQTAGGTTAPLAYEVIVAPREDRWEVVVLWGAPTLGNRPDPTDDDTDGSDDDSDTEADTGTTETQVTTS